MLHSLGYDGIKINLRNMMISRGEINDLHLTITLKSM